MNLNHPHPGVEEQGEEDAVEYEELREAVHCSRRLAIDRRAASRALLHLRRDHGDGRIWTLGDRGSFEMRPGIVELERPRAGLPFALHLAGRLWDPSGTTMTGVEVEILPAADRHVDVVLAPTQRLPHWFRDDDLAHWSDLARAALDEVCEELLWYASREEPGAARAS